MSHPYTGTLYLICMIQQQLRNDKQRSRSAATAPQAGNRAQGSWGEHLVPQASVFRPIWTLFPTLAASRLACYPVYSQVCQYHVPYDVWGQSLLSYPITVIVVSTELPR